MELVLFALIANHRSSSLEARYSCTKLAVQSTLYKGLFRKGVGTKANMSYVACKSVLKGPPMVINK